MMKVAETVSGRDYRMRVKQMPMEVGDCGVQEVRGGDGVGEKSPLEAVQVEPPVAGLPSFSPGWSLRTVPRDSIAYKFKAIEPGFPIFPSI
jgi:hypothetical protein